MVRLVMVCLCGASLACQQIVVGTVLSNTVSKPIRDLKVSVYQYDTWSRLVDLTLPNGVRAIYQYDACGRLHSLQYDQAGTSNKLITGFTYFYNKDGGIRKRIRSNGAGEQAIEAYVNDQNNNLKDYHCLGALCPKDSNGNVITFQHYTFDYFNNINMVKSNNTTRVYDYDKRVPTRLLGYRNTNPDYPNSQVMTYDHDGNIIRDDQDRVIRYDPLGQTRSVIDQQGVTAYFYNGEGIQVGEVLPSKHTRYFIYGQAHLLNTRDAGKQSSFLYGVSRLGQQDHNQMQYYLADQAQSVVNTVDQAGEMIRNAAYSPYGIESELSISGGASPLIQYFGFDGQLTDALTHWQFLGQGYRAYNPILHRFMSQDSFSPFDQGGTNGYVFGNNNPIMMSDPTGHMPFWANIGVGLVMGIAAGMFTSEMGGWGAFMMNMFVGAVGSNLDAIDDALHGQALHWKQVGIKAGIGAMFGAFIGAWHEEWDLEMTGTSYQRAYIPKAVQGEPTPNMAQGESIEPEGNDLAVFGCGTRGTSRCRHPAHLIDTFDNSNYVKPTHHIDLDDIDAIRQLRPNQYSAILKEFAPDGDTSLAAARHLLKPDGRLYIIQGVLSPGSFYYEKLMASTQLQFIKEETDFGVIREVFKQFGGMPEKTTDLWGEYELQRPERMRTKMLVFAKEPIF